MDISQVTNPIQQLLISAINPQGSATASNPDATSNPTQGVQGFHHHHHKSMADMISKMETAIDDAVKAGKLTDDQASQMKKELDSITQTLNNSQTSSGIQLTSDQLQQIRTEFQDVRKQLFDALNPQATSDAAQGVQGHHHHHHRSMADMISKMESTIDDALKAGKLTDDQASQMKKELDSITQTLNNSQANSGTQGSSGIQLTSDQLQQIRTEFQDVRKQLFDALNPQGSTLTLNGIDNLFKQTDVNGNGTIDENEFSTFINSLI